MATAKQIEANRKNAQKSTGPRTSEGKGRSRLNALTHGMRAETFDVLPNEDPALFRVRVDEWIAELGPADEAEERLVRRAAILDWKLDRAERYEHALLSKRIREAVAEVEQAHGGRVDEALAKLLPDLRVHWAVTDLTDLAGLRAMIEGSAEGCRRLIDAWAPLLRQAEAGGPWTWEQEFRAMRLLVPTTAVRIREPRGVACAQADRVLMFPDVAITPETWVDGHGLEFHRDAIEDACSRGPASYAEAAARLAAVASREIARLEGVLEERLEHGDLGVIEAEEAGILASFDPSADGERLRRYQSSIRRELARTLDNLVKMRREGRKPMKEANEPISDHPAGPALGVDVPATACRTRPASRLAVASRPPDRPAPIEPKSGPKQAEIRSNEPDRLHGMSKKQKRRERAMARLAAQKQPGR